MTFEEMRAFGAKLAEYWKEEKVAGTVSASERGSMAASTQLACSCMYAPTSSKGCINARSNNHASRGLIHRMSSGATPASKSQLHVSIAVLPAPMTV